MQALEHDNMQQDILNIIKYKKQNHHRWLAFETNVLLGALLMPLFDYRSY